MENTIYTDKAPSHIKASEGHDKKTGYLRRAVTKALTRMWRVYCRWDDRQRQRRHLGVLDDHLLDDIGVGRKAARQEASRWFLS